MSSLISLAGGGGAVPFFKEPKQAPDYIAGKYYLPSVNTKKSEAELIVADTIYYVPFVPFRTHTFDRISIYNTVDSDNGDSLRLGIYADSGSGGPGSLIEDAGEITVAAAIALNDLTISETLNVNTIYWLALVGDSTTSILSLYSATAVGLWPLGSPILPSYGFDSIYLSPNNIHGIPTESYSYAALPASATPDDVTGVTVPAICLRG